jgi:hypothetical protein
MRSIARAFFVLAFTLAALPVASLADCAGESANLLAAHDCGFAKGIAGWQANEGAQVAHAANDGHPQPGSIEGVAPGGSLQIESPCVAAKPDTTYRYGASVRLIEGSVYVCGAQVHHFADAACAEPLGPLAAMADLVQADWRAFDPARRPESGPTQNLATTEASTRALRVVLVCGGEAGFEVRFDDVSLAPR